MYISSGASFPRKGTCRVDLRLHYASTMSRTTKERGPLTTDLRGRGGRTIQPPIGLAGSPSISQTSKDDNYLHSLIQPPRTRTRTHPHQLSSSPNRPGTSNDERRTNSRLTCSRHSTRPNMSENKRALDLFGQTDEVGITPCLVARAGVCR